LTENPIVIDNDHDGGDLMDRSNHTSHQMAVNDLGSEDKNIDGDIGAVIHMGEGVAGSGLDDAATPQGDDRFAIATSASFSPEIPETDSVVTSDDEGQVNPSVQGDPSLSPSVKSRSTSGPGRADGCGSDWVFDVFADDGEAEGGGPSPSKQVRSSSPSLKAVENRSLPTFALVAEGVQVAGSAHGDRPPGFDQEYEVQQIVGESGSEYEVTAVTKIWLPKASVDSKLVRKYRAQRAATRVPTRRSSRLQNRSRAQQSCGW
jgi:hypothetical protein